MNLSACARSILSCPASAGLVVDGVDDVLSDLGADDGLAVQDQDGVPTFSCPPGTQLARSAARRRRALLTLEGGDRTSTDASAVLTLGGRLVHRGRDACACCSEARDVVVLVVDLVAVASHPGAPARRVEVEDFTAPEHRLNPGYLRRCVEHATATHQEELRHAVAALVDRPARELAGVSLSGLTPVGVRLAWIDGDGAHTRDIAFPSVARSPDDLGELLRRELSAGLC